MLRQKDLGVDLEVESTPKGYPSMVLYLDVLGPSPKTAGEPRYLLVMQDGHTKYAIAHLIPNMEAGMVT